MSTAEQIIAEHAPDPVDHFWICGSCNKDFDTLAVHAAHVVAALTNAGHVIVDDAREEWAHRNGNGGASIHFTREAAEAERAAWEQERLGGGGYRSFGPWMPPSAGIYRRTVTEWEPAAARVAEGGERGE